MTRKTQPHARTPLPPSTKSPTVNHSNCIKHPRVRPTTVRESLSILREYSETMAFSQIRTYFAVANVFKLESVSTALTQYRNQRLCSRSAASGLMMLSAPTIEGTRLGRKETSGTQHPFSESASEFSRMKVSISRRLPRIRIHWSQ